MVRSRFGKHAEIAEQEGGTQMDRKDLKESDPVLREQRGASPS